MPVVVWNKKLLFTVCAYFNQKKALEIVVELVNKGNENYYVMTLLGLIGNKATAKNALLVLKEIIFGKRELQGARAYYRRLLLCLLDSSVSQELCIVINDIVKAFEELKLEEIDPAVIQQIKNKIVTEECKNAI